MEGIQTTDSSSSSSSSSSIPGGRWRGRSEDSSMIVAVIGRICSSGVCMIVDNDVMFHHKLLYGQDLHARDLITYNFCRYNWTSFASQQPRTTIFPNHCHYHHWNPPNLPRHRPPRNQMMLLDELELKMCRLYAFCQEVSLLGRLSESYYLRNVSDPPWCTLLSVSSDFWEDPSFIRTRFWLSLSHDHFGLPPQYSLGSQFSQYRSAPYPLGNRSS